MKTTTKEDIRNLLLYNYKKELTQIIKEIEKNDIKEEKLFNKNKLESNLIYLIHKDFNYLENEIKRSFNNEYIKQLNLFIKLKIIFNRDNFLCKKKKDLEFKIYQLNKYK